MRPLLLILSSLVLSACGAMPGPATPAVAPSAASAEPQGDDMTLGPGDNGQAELDGGYYYISWVSDCDSLGFEWRWPNGGRTPMTAKGPSGQITVLLPQGVGSLERTASCSGSQTYTLHLEPAVPRFWTRTPDTGPSPSPP